VLFITREKQEALPQYNDLLEGDILRMEGEDRHRSDERLIHANENGDEVHSFYRERHHSPFTYHGRVELASFEPSAKKPSRFVFRLEAAGQTHVARASKQDVS
jgi:hypothetical protein